MSLSRWLTIIVLCLLPVLGQADGAAWKATAEWPRIEERAQAALIAHADGRQRMVVAVHLNMLVGDSGVWLVPVRGRPDSVRLDIAGDLPWLHGGTPHPDRAAREMVAHAGGIAALAAAPGSPLSVLVVGVAIPGLLESRSSAGQLGATVRSEGLIATVLAAASVDELAGLLAGLERPVPAASLTGFAPYLDGQHSLVAVRIDPLADPQADTTRAPALLLDFPSAEPWFPLRASAGAGRSEVLVQLVGWWTGGRQGMRCDPVLGGRIAVRGPGALPALAWLGLSADGPAPDHTRCRWYAADDSAFASDLTWSPDERPALRRGAALMAFEHMGWVIWLLLIPVGALAGSLLGWLLLRRPRWGALAGATFGIGGMLPMFIAANVTARLAVRGIPPSAAWPRSSPLCLIPMLSTVLLSLVLMVMIGAAVTGSEDLPVAIAIILGLHALVWVRWSWHRRAADVDEAVTVRRYAAWAYAAPSLAAVLLCLLALPVMWWVGQ